jgi:hypothetical protein
MTTPPALPPTDDQPSSTASTFPPPAGSQILRGLRAPLVGYGWLLVGAIAMVALIVVAANVGSTGDDTGVESDDTNALGVLIGMPFQIAAMSSLGSMHFKSDGVGASLYFPPLLLTLLFVVMTARSARRGEVIQAAGTRAVLAAVVGFAFAAVITPATWALAMRDHGASVHAASVSLFFGTWALTAAASYVGTSRAAQAPRPAWVPSDYAIAARLWAGSLAVWVAVAFVVWTIVASVKEDLWVGILSPIWGTTVSLDTYAVSHFGSLSVGGESIKVSDFSAAWTIVMIVGALALAVLTSIAWHLRRDIRETTLAHPNSWAVLPVAYTVGGLLVWLVPSVVLGGAIGAVGGSVTLQPAFWFVFVLLAWGVAVEAMSRYVAPSLASAVPSRLHALLRGPERAEDVAVGQPAGDVVPPRPLTAAEVARYKRLGIAGGVLVAIGIAGWIALSVVNSQLYGPKDQASAYLDAIVDGDLDEANDLAPTGNDADDSLLTSEIYQASKERITGYTIDRIDQNGDSATAHVSLEGLDGTEKATLTLVKDGKTDVLFTKWKVSDGGLARAVSLTVPDGAGDLSVNSVTVGSVQDDVWLLPGTYDFNAFAGNKWLEASGDPVVVAADDDYQYAEIPDATASAAFRDEVQSQIEAFLAKCMASTVLDPDGCPNSTFAGPDVRKVKWTLVEAPTPDFESFDGSFPADLSYGDSGTAKVTYESDESYGFGTPDWRKQTETTDLYLNSVTVNEQGDGLVVTIGD